MGYDGTILHTIDEGENWITQISRTSNDLESVFFIDINTGWAVGGRDTILSYSDYTFTDDDKPHNYPRTFSLAQNYPNPFNPETEIAFDLPEAVKVTVLVYNILGQVVEILMDSELEAGHYTVQWNASDMVSGLYFYSIKANDFTSTKKMVLMR